MKSLTRVGLPILLVAAAVFGITFITMYSPEDDSNGDQNAPSKQRAAGGEPPLKFFTTRAVVSTPQSTPKHMWYWDPNVEAGAPGHYGFWCQNRRSQPVKIWVESTNCQCAGVDVAAVPHDAFGDYSVVSALAGSPFCPAPSPIAAFAHLKFERSLQWQTMIKESVKTEQTIPAAGTSAPQLAIVRLGWVGKGEVGDKTIAAGIYTGVGEETPTHISLGAETKVVPAFDLLSRSGSTWSSVRELSVGEMRENGEVKHTIYMASTTRPYFLYTVAVDRPHPCITWSDPVMASGDEITDLRRHMSGGGTSLRHIKSLYKAEIRIRERSEITSDGKTKLHQLDLGPIDRKLTVSGVNAGRWTLMLQGRVIGDITMLGGGEGRIELNTFDSNFDKTKDVVLLADRPGIDLSLVEEETRPNYLKVKLEPHEPTPDGRKQWRLRVTVPKDHLIGTLPDSSGITLKTSGASQRRLRLPVRGTTFDAGGPRF